jgi:hypothetical protein
MVERLTSNPPDYRCDRVLPSQPHVCCACRMNSGLMRWCCCWVMRACFFVCVDQSGCGGL